MNDLTRSAIRCAFLLNPDTDDPEYVRKLVVAKYPFAEPFNGQVILGTLKVLPPQLLRMGSFVTTLLFQGTSIDIELVYLGMPMSSREIKERRDEALRRIRRNVDYAINGLHANVVGLGGATATNGISAVIGEEFKNRIAVTSGNGFTAVMAVNGGLGLFRYVGRKLEGASVAIIGAAGLAGSNVAHLIASELDASNVIHLVGRRDDTSSRLATLAHELQKRTEATVMASSLEQAICRSDLILTVSSSTDPLSIDPGWFRPGTVVVDVARPRDIADRIGYVRNDIFVIDGGIVSCPFTKQSFRFGFEEGILFACMAETILIGLMGCNVGTHSIGTVNPGWLKQLSQVAYQAGMKLAGWRSFEQPLTEERICQIKSNAGL